MFGPDYLCIAAALAMLSAIPIVALWPDKRDGWTPPATGSKKPLPKTIPHPGPREDTKR